MRSELMDEVRRAIIGNPADWVMRSDVKDYFGSEAMKRKLIEERQVALAENFDLRKEVAVLSGRVQGLELGNREKELSLKQLRRNSLCAFLISVGAMVLISIGTNLIVNPDDQTVGAALTGVGLILEVVAFVLSRG